MSSCMSRNKAVVALPGTTAYRPKRRFKNQMARLIWSVAIGFVLLAATPQTLFSQVRLASGFGQSNIGGQQVFVHVTVAVPPGLDGPSVVEDAVRGQGARPIQSAAFSLTGLDWKNNSPEGAQNVLQSQNFSDLPDALTDPAVLALKASQETWKEDWQENNNVSDTSEFSFLDGGFTDQCPSLAKQCPGRQFADQLNDVGFISIGGCCTLAATWFLRGSSDSTSAADEPEADIVVNSRVNWNSFDLETVLLHELGHALGLGHSSVAGAVMAATYTVPIPDLQEDDVRGVTYLYPRQGWVGLISGTVVEDGSTPELAIEGATVSIADFPVSDTTESDGSYSLTGVPDIGEYAVTVSAKGYLSQTIANIDVPTNLPTIKLVKESDDGGGGNGGGKDKCKKNGPFACP